MSAAVQAGIPFGVKFAHIHGGETTLGAIDNIYRHQITLASTIHFASTEIYKKRIEAITGYNHNVYDVGSLSLDGIKEYKFMEEQEFRDNYGIPNLAFILTTFHPETVQHGKNREYASKMKSALSAIANDYFLVITMPNADINGMLYRNAINDLKVEKPNRILCIENFGKKNYFNAMKYAEFLIGNTSSGIIEAAAFGKYVVNVGDRQKGRLKNKNVIDSTFDTDDILTSVQKVKYRGQYTGNNFYMKSNSSDTIIKKLKSYYEKDNN